MKEIVLECPKSFNELSRKQTVVVFQVLGDPNLNEIDKKVALFIYLSGINKKVYFSLNKEAQAILLYHVNFCFEKVNLTKNQYPKIKKFYGPEDDFEDMSFLEFITADTYYNAYTITQREDYLHQFIAVLYRRKREFDAEAFKPKQLEKRIPQLYSPQLITCTIAYWGGCLYNLSKRYTHLFQNKSNRQKKGKTSKQNNWEEILFDVAGDKMGTIDDVAQKNVKTVFAFMNNNIKEAKKNIR